jgi:transposase
MVFKQRFNSEVMIAFLRRLLRHSQRKVFLIVDGHPVHQSARVTQGVEQHRSQIRLFFLPGYSPELNPNELLNQDVKINALGRQRPQDLAEMVHRLRTYPRSTQHRPDVVKSYFQQKQVAYAAE